MTRRSYPPPRNAVKPSRFVLRNEALRGAVSRRGIALVLLAGALALAAPSASRFFRFNEAYYHANLGEWSRVLDLLRELRPLRSQEGAALRLRTEALLHLGRPFEAIRALEEAGIPRAEEPTPAISGEDAGDSEARRRFDLLAIGWLLSERREDLLARFEAPPTALGRVIADYLRAPSPASLAAAESRISRRFPERRLYLGAVRALDARERLDRDRVEEAAAILGPLAEQFPLQFAFLHANGLASLRAGQVDRGAAWALAADRALRGVASPGEADRLRARWREDVEAEVENHVLTDRPLVATRTLRALAGPLEIPAARGVELVERQGAPSPALALDLAALGDGDVPAWAKAARMRDAKFQPPSVWKPGPGGEPRAIRLSPARASLFSPADEWELDVPPPGENVRRRALFVCLRGSIRGGIGAGFSLRVGRRPSSGFLSDDAPAWFAVDLPMTLDAKLPVTLQMSFDDMRGVDPREGDRNLYLLDAWLLEFDGRRGGGTSEAVSGGATAGSDGTAGSRGAAAGSQSSARPGDAEAIPPAEMEALAFDPPTTTTEAVALASELLTTTTKSSAPAPAGGPTSEGEAAVVPSATSGD